MIELKELSAGYPGKPVLHSLNLTIPTGKITVLLGPNGCGKTTLLKVLCGILPSSAGTVTLDGQQISGLSPKLLAKKIAYLPQNRPVPDMTVERMVLHGRFPFLQYPRRYQQVDYDAANAAMAQMQISDLSQTLLQNLSGGQRQKVYIAMALAQNTPVILLDEPTSFLDVSHQLQMMQQARALRDAGKTVVMVLHDLSLALQVADQVVVLSNGNLEAVGTADCVFHSGCLERVFEVGIDRVETAHGWCYVCYDQNR